MSEKKPKKVPWASLPTRLGIAAALLLIVFPFAWDATNGNLKKRFSPLSQDFNVDAFGAKHEAEKAAEAEREKAAKAKGKEKGGNKPNSEPKVSETPKPDSPEPATATDEGGEPTVDPPAPKRQGGNGGKKRKPLADDRNVGSDKDEKDALEAAKNAINNI